MGSAPGVRRGRLSEPSTWPCDRGDGSLRPGRSMREEAPGVLWRAAPPPPPARPQRSGPPTPGVGQWTCVGAGPALDVRSGLAGRFIFTVMTGWPSAHPGVSLLPTARPDVGRGLSLSGRHSSALLCERGGRGSLTGPRWALDASCLTGTHTPTRVCVSACSTSVPGAGGAQRQ